MGLKQDKERKWQDKLMCDCSIYRLSWTDNFVALSDGTHRRTLICVHCKKYFVKKENVLMEMDQLTEEPCSVRTLSADDSLILADKYRRFKECMR